MRKVFKSSLRTLMLALSLLLVFNSCGTDAEDNYELDKTLIYGSWSELTVEDSEYATMTLEVIWSFSQNNVASQQVIVKLNGYTMENVKNSYSYVYKSNGTITFTDAKNNVWTYEVSVNGNHMRLGNSEKGYFELTKK